MSYTLKQMHNWFSAIIGLIISKVTQSHLYSGMCIYFDVV